MPFIKIFGIQPTGSENEFAGLRSSIKEQVASIKALETDESKVTVLFVAGMEQPGTHPFEIVADICMFSADQRTASVKTELATVVCNILAEAYEQATAVAVLPREYDPIAEGYYRIRR